MKTILTIVLAFYCTGLYAASAVDLFDQDRGQEKKPDSVKKAIPKKTRSRARRVVFSLSGISKIGDNYVLYFNTTKGQRNRFSWHKQQESGATKIYDDYEIDKIIDRTVYLNIVTSKPCIEDQKQGVSCDKKNRQMVMQLVRKKAISRPKSGRARPGTKTKPATQTKRSPRKFPFKRKLENKK